jgi:hypothetical protein
VTGLNRPNTGNDDGDYDDNDEDDDYYNDDEDILDAQRRAEGIKCPWRVLKQQLSLILYNLSS